MNNSDLSSFTVDVLTKSLIKANQAQNEIDDDEEEIIENYDYITIDDEENKKEEEKKDEIDNKEEDNLNDNTINNDEQINNKEQNNNEENINIEKEINNKKNDNNEEKNSADKTIFSKIAEDMYYKIIKNYDNIYNYQDFTNDQFLAIYSNKINNCENTQIIKNFLDRNKQYLKDKNGNKNTINNRVDQINSFFSKKLSQNEVNNIIKEFNNKQIRYNLKKKKDIEELSNKIQKNKQQDYLQKPIINKTNLNYFKKKVKYEFKIRNLTPNRNNSNKNKENKKNIKMNNEDINNLVTKLHNEAKEKEIKLKNCKSSDDLYKNKKMEFNFANKSTNIMLFNNFLKQYQKEIKNIKSISSIKNPTISFDELKLLLEHMHYINEDTGQNILKDIWKNLTSYSISNKIDSDLILIFIICFNGLYKNDIEEIIQKKLNWIDLNKYDKLLKKRKDFENKYKELRKNRREFYFKFRAQKEKEYLDNKYREKEYHQSKSYDIFSGIKRRKLSKSYNFIISEKRKKLEELRLQNERSKLKECTFTPNIDKIKSSNNIKKKNNSIYNNINYSPNINKIPNKHTRNIKNQNIYEFNNETNNNTFYPNIKNNILNDKNKTNNNEIYNKNYKYHSDYKIEPLITFEIQIRNKTDFLNYYENDNIDEVVQKFVKKHNLTNESKRQIKEAIIKKLEIL